MALLVDRRASSEIHLRPHRHATANFMNNPQRFRSRHELRVQHREGEPLLEQAGWKKGADGIREKDGKKLKFVFQTSINQPRQKDPGDRQAGVRRRPASTSSSSR